MCPDNLIGTVDVFLVSHHGFDESNSKALVWALHPKVAIMDNGPHKGGSPEAWQTVADSPGLIDFWQLHKAEDAGEDHNVAAAFVANSGDADGNYIKVLARSSGTFTVSNSRYSQIKTYEH